MFVDFVEGEISIQRITKTDLCRDLCMMRIRRPLCYNNTNGICKVVYFKMSKLVFMPDRTSSVTKKVYLVLSRLIEFYPYSILFL